MSKICILDPLVANKIAAGEVVERPAAVVKELVENAIDAGATKVFVEIQSGGKKLIRVTDNGRGIPAEEMVLAFERHATSKVTKIEDIYALTTLGFRGEALASIAAVSHVEMISKPAAAEVGQMVQLSGGKLVASEAIGTQNGTTIVVRDLFYNTPARMKFMKSTAAETGAISDLMTRLALSHSDICFTYVVDQKNVFKTPGDGDALKVAYAVLEKDLAKNLTPVSLESDLGKVTGFVSKLSYTRGNRSNQIFFVNQRFIKSRTLLDAVSGAYLGQLPIGRFPSAVLYLELPADQVDVNIHPAKTEVKFHREPELKDWLLMGLRQAIRSLNQIPDISQIVYKMQEPAQSTQVSEPEHNGKSLYKEVQNMEKPGQSYMQKGRPEVAPLPESRREPSAAFDLSLLSSLKMEDVLPKEAVVFEQTSLIESSEGLYDHLIYIGQIFNAYLLFQKEGKLYVIDQHAGHEKVLYERFRRDFMAETVVRQILAKPILLEFSHADWTLLMAETSHMAKIGFVYEAFGDASIVIREVPMAFHTPGTETFFKDLADSLSHAKLSVEEVWKDRVIKAACKAAIKANDPMDAFEVKQLLADLKGLEDPYTCPHGRPIIVTITKSEFEKMFKRT